jgi:small subunit ribosomal protein S1
MGESFVELFEGSAMGKDVRPGAIVKGKVVAIENGHVVVHAGLKSEGIIPISEFYDEAGQLEVAVGDEVDVYIDSFEDGTGETVLSREKAKKAKVWDELAEAMENDELVTGVIVGRVKGGFTVQIANIQAFLPGSLVDLRPVRDVSYLEGKPLEFKLIKLDRKRNNVVVSRRAVLEQERESGRHAIMEGLEEGAVVHGVVKNLTEYGAFVDIGGIDGLLHVADMDWKRVRRPSEVVKVGDELDVKILKFDRERQRISLGLKQLTEDPWSNVERRFPVGSRVFGKVTNVTDYGCFVEVEEGIEGLVHASEMDWTNKSANPHKLLKVGDEVEVAVLGIDMSRRRMSLGMKQTKSSPWQEFAQEHAVGTKVVGTVKSITDFGVFVGLDNGIDGLIYTSDLTWDEDPSKALSQYKKGDEVEAVVLSVDPERERIALGIKQLDDPLLKFTGDHPKGSIVEGLVVAVDDKRIQVELDDGVKARLGRAEWQDKTHLSPSIGDRIRAVVDGIDRKSRTLLLVPGDEDVPLRRSGPTLGDLYSESVQERGG